MASELDKLKRRINGLGQFLYGRHRIDWYDTRFTDEKAYVCAVIASIAYLKLTDFELKHHDYVKLIPCLSYQEIVASGVNIDLADYLQESEFRDLFVVITAHVLAVGMVHNDVIFISLRGTRPLSLPDWMIDFHVRSTPAYVDGMPSSFHSGFYIHICQCIEKIADEVNKRQGKPLLPVYVVGHSLGGAMAAILYAVDGSRFSSHHRGGSEISVNINTTASYTYGMPRYGNEPVVGQLRSPFSVFHRHDIVPTVPLKSLGYADPPSRYQLSDDGTLLHTRKTAWRPLRLTRHFMENYIEMLGKTVGVS